uniref:Terpene synthase metal-binding domain-containing protein n=1 Tax=Setaria italica TaxID=4555 RepID=K3ZE87_SETIT
MMVEAEWRITGYPPSMEEYMSVALPSFVLGPIIPVSAYLRPATGWRSLLWVCGGGDIQAAKREVRSVMKASRMELLRLEVGEEGGSVPGPCRRLFWNMSKVVHLFYMDGDGYASPTEIVRAANAVVLDPLWRLPAGEDRRLIGHIQ